MNITSNKAQQKRDAEGCLDVQQAVSSVLWSLIH